MPFVDHAGARLHCTLHGTSGEPILLIQGVGVIGNGWKPQVDALSRSYRVLTFDNRGIGQSRLSPNAPFSIEQMASDARALMDAAGWASCHVVGHSMGGVIAQRLALTCKNRLRSLALLCTVAKGADAVRMTPQMVWHTLRTSFGSKASRRRAFLELIYPKRHLASLDCDALAAELAPLFGHDLAEQPPNALRQAMALRRHDCRAELPALTNIPTLVLSAAEDPIAPSRFGSALADLIPGARFVELAEASHGAPIHRAATVNSELRDLFQQR